MENKSNDEYLTHYGIPGMKWGHNVIKEIKKGQNI